MRVRPYIWFFPVSPLPPKTLRRPTSPILLSVRPCTRVPCSSSPTVTTTLSLCAQASVVLPSPDFCRKTLVVSSPLRSATRPLLPFAPRLAARSLRWGPPVLVLLCAPSSTYLAPSVLAKVPSRRWAVYLWLQRTP